MKYLLAVGIVVLTLGMVACGNTPTGPEEELVGTWRFENTDFIRVFSLDGDDLTLIFTKTLLLEALRQDENFDAEVYTIYNEVLQEDDVFRFFFKRR